MQSTSITSKLIQTPEGIHKAAEFIQFCQWSAQPKEVRQPKEQKEFKDVLKVDEATLSLWKREPEFEFNRRLFIRQWLGDDLPDVMNTVKKGALRGNPSHIDTFLRWLGELSAGTQVAVQVNNYQATPEDMEGAVFAWLKDNPGKWEKVKEVMQ